MTPLRRALVGLGAAGAVLALPVAAITATSDHTQLSGLMAALGLLVAWSFLGTGLYLWDRRPDNLTGPLMVALAFSWLVAGLSASSVPGVYIVGVLCNSAPVRDPHASAVRVPGRAAAHQVGSPLRRARLPDHDGVAADGSGLLRPGGRRRLPAVPEQPAPDLERPGRLRHRQRDLERARGGRPGRADLASRAPLARGRRPGRAPPRRTGLVGRRSDGRAGACPAR